MSHSNYLPLYSASDIFYSCQAAWEFMNKNQIAVCTQWSPSTNTHRCFSSSYSLKDNANTLHIRYWEPADENYASLSQRPYFVIPSKLLLVPRSENSIDYLILLIGKTVLGHLGGELKNFYETFVNHANKGWLSLSQYEEKKYTHLYNTAESFRELANSCADLWQSNFTHPKLSNELPNSTAALIVSTISQTGLDQAQSDWKSLYKEKYCSSGKKNNYSCGEWRTQKESDSKSTPLEDVAIWFNYINSNQELYSRYFLTEIRDHYYKSNLPELKISRQLSGCGKMEEATSEIFANLVL